jgi:putative tryptophan/tyrosine transport system substrate-binding protein
MFAWEGAMLGIRRREFTALVGGAAAWPLAARTQQPGPVRRVGVLMVWAERDPDGTSYLATFGDELARLGWVEGRNLRAERRWSSDSDAIRTFAHELVELQSDVLVAITQPAAAALRTETRTIPIVFTHVHDPVGAGFIAGLPRPGGNMTGFSHPEATIVGKWLGLIKEVAPTTRRIALMFNPDYQQAQSYLRSFDAFAQARGVEPVIAPVRDDEGIEARINALGREQGGLIVVTDGFLSAHRATIIVTANRNKVPTISNDIAFARNGGLLTYVSNFADMFVGAAGYVNRILRGEKPGDLPVQLPTRFELSISVKTAKVIGLTVPNTLLVSATELIE